MPQQPVEEPTVKVAPPPEVPAVDFPSPRPDTEQLEEQRRLEAWRSGLGIEPRK